MFVHKKNQPLDRSEMLKVVTAMKISISIFSCVLFTITIRTTADEIQKAKQFLNRYNLEFGKSANKYGTALFNFYSNMNNTTNLIATETQFENLKGRFAKNATKFDFQLLRDRPDIVRQLTIIRKSGIMLDSNDRKLLSELQIDMIKNLETASMCSWIPNADGRLDKDCAQKWQLSDAEHYFGHEFTRNSGESVQKQIWDEFRIAAGVRNKGLYNVVVDLYNTGARATGFQNYAEFWHALYEDDNFEATMEKLWYQVLPMYENLHTYTRRKLSQYYNLRFVGGSPIPSHLTGMLVSMSFSGIGDILVPFPNATVDGGDLQEQVYNEMESRHYTTKRVAKMADEFYQSMGFEPMPQSFWKKSMFVKPDDGRKANCWPKAFDFYKNKDVRIQMCGDIGTYWLFVYHHEMGHCQYYLSYSRQPMAFRSGANPGFHEAIGDTIDLSVRVPEHLQALGLLHNYRHNDEQDLNFLMDMASSKIGSLPFFYLMDKWRYGVFSGIYPYEKWQESFWKLVFRYQGLSIPVPRTKHEFDAGAISHLVDNTETMSYFIAFIIQFQFYKGLCQVAGYRGPLHHCSLYKSKKAGKVFSKALKLGASKPWPEVMQILTGQREMNASAMMEYFKPLNYWLTKENMAAKDCFGWSSEKWPDHVERNLPQPRCK